MNKKTRLGEFSSLSVICSVDKFVNAVERMNETIMVPSRLLNIDLTAEKEDIPDLLRNAADPYAYYSMINNVKNNVVWGLESNDEDVIMPNTFHDEVWSTDKPAPSNETKTHARRISTVSINSNNSETECERLSDGGDSGVEGEDAEPINELTASLKLHLTGLQNCLVKLTKTANYITDKYVDDVHI